MSNRGFGLQDDGSWASGRCMGSPPEEWHCRGCGCEWPTSGYRFHCFIDVVAPDHETARRAVEARVFGGAVPDGVEVDPGLIGDAVGHLGTDGDEDRWTWD